MAQEEKVVSEQETQQRIDGMNGELDSVIGGEPGFNERNIARHIEQRGAETGESNQLIQLAIQSGADVDKLERLIELRNREIARESKDVYERQFAQMQNAFGKVVRTREAQDANGRRMYAFAPLEDIVAVVGPTIAQYGFRYRFEEERIEGVDEKRVWCIVTGHGHEERTFIDVPIPPASKMTNAIQQRGSASSYGKRYAFLAAFGLTLNDEDDDARACSLSEVDALLPELAKLEAATTLEELKTVYKQVFAYADSESQKMLVINAKNRRKEALNAGN